MEAPIVNTGIAVYIKKLMSGKLSLIIIDQDRSGTHENYDVLYNSECSNRKFDDLTEILPVIESIVKERI